MNQDESHIRTRGVNPNIEKQRRQDARISLRGKVRDKQLAERRDESEDVTSALDRFKSGMEKGFTNTSLNSMFEILSYIMEDGKYEDKQYIISLGGVSFIGHLISISYEPVNVMWTLSAILETKEAIGNAITQGLHYHIANCIATSPTKLKREALWALYAISENGLIEHQRALHPSSTKYLIENLLLPDISLQKLTLDIIYNLLWWDDEDPSQPLLYFFVDSGIRTHAERLVHSQNAELSEKANGLLHDFFKSELEFDMTNDVVMNTDSLLNGFSC